MTGEAASLVAGAMVALYALAVAGVALLGVQAGVLALAARRHRDPDLTPLPGDAAAWPRVTVQVPLYNEPAVAARVVRAVGALDYPDGRLDVQVLDDSTDATPSLVARALRDLAPTVPVAHLRRPTRAGFKAGALAHGLARSDADVFAVFDADFVPTPDTLRRLVPPLVRASDVGCVQARWAHRNEAASWRTRAQAMALDLHFGVEHRGRSALGALVNFNGTAAVWRRAALEDAGGWRDDSIAEDFDLSVRARLVGWRVAVADAVAVPAELPATVAAWRVQQRRWATGGAEVLRLHGRRLVGAALPVRVRALALLHVGGALGFVATAALALLHAPAWLVGVPRGVAALGTVGAAGYVLAVAVASAHGRTAWRDRLAAGARAPLFLAATAALAPSLVAGILRGLHGHRTPFERTDKVGDAADVPLPDVPSVPAAPWPRWADGALAAYHAVGWALLWQSGAVDALPLQTLLVAGSAGLAWATWAERRQRGRRRAERRTFPGPVGASARVPAAS